MEESLTAYRIMWESGNSTWIKKSKFNGPNYFTDYLVVEELKRLDRHHPNGGYQPVEDDSLPEPPKNS